MFQVLNFLIFVLWVFKIASDACQTAKSVSIQAHAAGAWVTNRLDLLVTGSTNVPSKARETCSMKVLGEGSIEVPGNGSGDTLEGGSVSSLGRRCGLHANCVRLRWYDLEM